MTAPVHERQSYIKVRDRLPNFDPNVTEEDWLEQFSEKGIDKTRFETCWYTSDDSTTAYILAIQDHSSRPIVKPEFFKNMIEIPRGWTNVIHHSNSWQYLDKLLLNGPIVGGRCRKEGGQTCYFSAAHPLQSNAVPDQNS